MDSFFSRYKNGLVLGTVLFLQVIGLAIQVRRPAPNSPDRQSVRLLRLWVVSVVGPPEHIAHSIGLGVRGVWSNYIDLRHTRQRNRELQSEVDRLRLEQAGMAEDARQGHRLQQLLGFTEHYVYKTLPAQVIGTAGTDMSRLLLIDKGFKNGVRIDMPVITPDGIVGKIRDVFPYSAQVLEISDQSSGAGVILETTRIRGVLRGNAYSQPQIINIMPDERIQSGERVITSGGDQVFPRGLTVGYVEKVVNDPERNPYIDIVVRPAASLFRLEEVLVITNTGAAVPQTEQTDVAQSESDAARHGASEELADKLPSVRDPNDPNPPAAEPEPDSPDGEVARPVRPPSALRPDRFSPGTTPDAATLAPGSAFPHPPHNPAAAQDSNAAPKPAIKAPAPPAVAPRSGAVGAATPGVTQPGSANSAAAKKPVGSAATAAAPAGAPAHAPHAATPGAGTAGASTQPGGVNPPARPAVQPSGTDASAVPGNGIHTVVNDGPNPKKKPPSSPSAPKPGSAAKPATAPAGTPPKPKPAPLQSVPPQSAPAPNPSQPQSAPPQGGR